MVTVLATLFLATFFGVKLNHFNSATVKCINGTTPSVMIQTRSGSFSLLGNISNPMCSEPVAQVSLFSQDSSVEIRQIFCKYLDSEMLPFKAGPIDFSDVSLADGPKPVFDENFSPLTYFMDGSIQVILTNTTTNLSSATVELCLFTNCNDYNKFLTAGVNWKNSSMATDCNSTVVTVENDQSYTVSINISQPSFVFVGIASIASVHIEQMKVNAMGHNISGFGTRSAKVCQLNGKDMKCSFSLLKVDGENQDICVVAYEDGNPDGTYDYSNLTFTLPTLSKKSRKQYKIFGYSSLGTSALTVVILSIIVAIVMKWICTRNSTQCMDRYKSEASQASLSNTKIVNHDRVTVHDTTINTEPNIPVCVETTPITQVDTTDGDLLVTSPGAKIIKATDPASNPVGIHTPIQESTHDLSAPSSPILRPTIPIQEGTQQLSPKFNVDDSKSSENNSDARFEEAVPETTLQCPA